MDIVRSLQDMGEENYLNLNIKLLFYLGFWPNKALVGRISIRIFCMMIMYVVYLNGFIFEIYENHDDIMVVTESLDIFLCVALSFHKSITIISYEDEFKSLVRTLKSNFFTLDTEMNRNPVVLKCEKQTRMLTTIYMALTGFTVVFFLSIPLVDGLLHQVEDANTTYVWKFPFQISFPVDTSYGATYTVIYLFHTYVGFVHVLLIPGIDNVIIGLMDHACGQFKILNHSLENLRKKAISKVKGVETEFWKVGRNTETINFPNKTVTEEEINNNYNDEESFQNKNGIELESYRESQGGETDIANEVQETSQEVRIEMEKNLRECSKHHQTILEFVDLLESIVNRAMMTQFFASSICICTTAFQFTVAKGQTVKLMTMAGYMIACLFQLGLYCYYGDKIKEESEAVYMAAYSSEWYHASESLKRSVRLIMLRSQRPAVMTIGKFAHLSLETYAEIIKGSYTYFTMLTGMND